MFLDTVDNFAKVAETKAAALRARPGAFWISAMMAGAYVGLGIILIFSVGATVDPSIHGAPDRPSTSSAQSRAGKPLVEGAVAVRQPIGPPPTPIP